MKWREWTVAKGTVKPIYIYGRFDTLFLVSLGQTTFIESVFLPSTCQIHFINTQGNRQSFCLCPLLESIRLETDFRPCQTSRIPHLYPGTEIQHKFYSSSQLSALWSQSWFQKLLVRKEGSICRDLQAC